MNTPPTEKHCYKCEKTLPIARFQKDSSRKDGYMNKCGRCHEIAKRERRILNSEAKTARAKTQKRYTERVVSQRPKKPPRIDQTPIKQEYVRNLKESTPCADCGIYAAYYCMDYDHTGKEKNFEISTGVHKSSITLDMIIAEIALCELVCAMCHRIRTHNQGYRRNI